MTRFRKTMLEGLQGRNYSEGTTRFYIRIVEDSAPDAVFGTGTHGGESNYSKRRAVAEAQPLRYEVPSTSKNSTVASLVNSSGLLPNSIFCVRT